MDICGKVLVSKYEKAFTSKTKRHVFNKIPGMDSPI